tara:strand:+ start:334 stop:705 length:372 start_codon:yes stop_codon:yes gene_type:complete
MSDTPSEKSVTFTIEAIPLNTIKSNTLFGEGDKQASWVDKLVSNANSDVSFIIGGPGVGVPLGQGSPARIAWPRSSKDVQTVLSAKSKEEEDLRTIVEKVTDYFGDAIISIKPEEFAPTKSEE